MKEDFEFLEEKLFLKEDVISILEEIAEIEQLIFKSKNLLSEKTKNDILHQFFLKLEREGKVDLDLKKQFEFLEELKNYLQNLPVLKMEIAFFPPKKTIEKFSDWLKKEVGKKFILDIYFNQKIVGGAILEYGGKYKNFSLAKEIDKFFERKS